MGVNDPEQPRYGVANASRADHIRRLRARIKDLTLVSTELRGILQGILDLLADEE